MLITESKLLLLAEKVVVRYINKGVIPSREKEDTQMFIVEKFLQKQSQIQKKFLGKANITTYCISVLNNMCCEVIRKELKHWKNELNEIPDIFKSNSEVTSQKAVIQDEINYLDKIFLLFDAEKPKVNIILSYYYHLNVKQKDINEYIKVHNNKNVKPKLVLGENLNKGEIFSNLADFICKVENKNIKPDAVRMWYIKITNTIIDRLNGSFNRAYYDRDSFQVLYELYTAQRS